MLIINKKPFYTGLTMMVFFAVILIVLMSPVMNGKTVIQTADDLFNSLTKGSTYQIPKLQSNASKFEGKAFDVSVSMKSKEEAINISKIFSMAGAVAETSGTNVKISGDLGKVSKVVLVDSDELFKNNESVISTKYGINGRETLYYWWAGFNAMESKFKTENKSEEMSFVATIKGKAIELAYNFNGIQADKVDDRAGITIFMLIFYVIYTVWYGFAIMYMLEGLGIIASHGEKAEA